MSHFPKDLMEGLANWSRVSCYRYTRSKYEHYQILMLHYAEPHHYLCVPAS